MINTKNKKDGEKHGGKSELIASSFILYFRENRRSWTPHISYLRGNRSQLILINQEIERYVYYLNSFILFKAVHTI